MPYRTGHVPFCSILFHSYDTTSMPGRRPAYSYETTTHNRFSKFTTSSNKFGHLPNSASSRLHPPFVLGTPSAPCSSCPDTVTTDPTNWYVNLVPPAVLVTFCRPLITEAAAPQTEVPRVPPTVLRKPCPPQTIPGRYSSPPLEVLLRHCGLMMDATAPSRTPCAPVPSAESTSLVPLEVLLRQPRVPHAGGAAGLPPRRLLRAGVGGRGLELLNHLRVGA